MAMKTDTLNGSRRPRTRAPVPSRSKGAGGRRTPSVLAPWISAQSVNLNRHAAALRPFRNDEFGTADSSPSPGHIQAVNQLLGSLRGELLKMTRAVSESAEVAAVTPTTSNLQRLLGQKE